MITIGKLIGLKKKVESDNDKLMNNNHNLKK